MDLLDLMRGMDINEIRRRNFRQIVDTQFEGSYAKIAEPLGKQSSYFSRVFTEKEKHRRNIGSAMAREIEQVAGKPEGWLDQVHENEEELNIPPETIEALKAIATLPSDKQQLLLQMAQAMGVNLGVNVEDLQLSSLLGERVPAGSMVITDAAEQALIHNYRRLNEPGKEAVYAIVAATLKAMGHQTEELPKQKKNLG